MNIPKEILSQHIAVLGKTGSGKTSTAKLLVEQVVAGDARVCIIDPLKSDWWGLTSSRDGKHAGLPFHILGGPHGHVPMHAAAGAAIGAVVASGALKLSIIDMADFDPGGPQKFFSAFAQSLFRNMRGIVYLVIEEAHTFAPKDRPGLSEESLCIHWMKKLATAGRSKGIRLIVCTQRTQELHNAVLGSCDTLIAHRFIAPADQKPIIDWLKANAGKTKADEVAASLSKLKTGQGWVCSGEADILRLDTFPRIHTYDNTATPDHDSAKHQVKTAPVDAGKLTEIIGASVEEAKKSDPAELRKKIAELERQLREKPAAAVFDYSKIINEAVDVWRFRVECLTKALRAIEEMGVSGKAAECAQLGERWLTEPSQLITKNITKAHESSQKITETPRNPPGSSHLITNPRRSAPASNGDVGQLGQGEQRILLAIAQHRDAGATREQIAVLTGYKATSRRVYLQKLHQAGFIQYSGNDIYATRSGVEALGDDFAPLPTGPELREHWLARLPEGERRIFQFLCDQYPARATNDAIEEATNYKATSRRVYVQKLASRKLVESNKEGVRASEELF